jgi:hypothetical protein
MCQWNETGKSVPPGKMDLVTIMGQMGSMSPVDRFNNAKRPIPQIPKTPVVGVGDDAYYIETASPSINVRNGQSVFTLRISGPTGEQLKAALKTLAQKAASRT